MDGVAETVGPEVAAAMGLRPGPHGGRGAGRSHLLPGHCHLMVEGVGGEELLLLLEQRGVCASAASSCASGAVGASHVVEALAAAPAPEGLAVDRTAAPLRLTLGADTAEADVDATIEAMADALELLRDRPGRWDR
jgi:cysteine desulfurase